MNSFTFRNVSEALPVLCKEVLERGDEVNSRNGLTKELPFTHITLTHPWERYITTPGRRASLPAQVAESMWILAGRNDIEWLGHYLPRAAEFSDDGKTWRGGYGPRLRQWENEVGGPYVDQLAHVVELLKKEPLTRRAVMSIYNPMIDSVNSGKDVPCNDFIQFMSRLGKLDMHVFIRSNDLMWGWSGINAFEWSALQEIVAGMLGIGIGQLHFSISSLHLYDRHWKKAEEISRSGGAPWPESVPQFVRGPIMKTIEDLDRLVDIWFKIEDTIRIDAEAARKAIENFPEPMLQSWLVVLAKFHDPNFHWPGRPSWPDAMIQAWQSSPKKVVFEQLDIKPTVTPFVAYVDNLHREKHAAYGDSWKRRGEMLGIMANIARKIDRLGYSGGGDSSTDTAVDTLAYLLKYRLWLDEHFGNQTSNSDDPDHFTSLLKSIPNQPGFPVSPATAEKELTELFEVLEHQVEEKRVTRHEVVESMIMIAYQLATHLWWKEQNETRAFTGYPS